jgi:exodeoxyribonuclease VII small subunit
MPPKETQKKSEPPTFEEAMSRLEAVVEEMESEQLPLETLLARYEEGMKLVGFCTEKLSDAEKRIQMIARAESGAPALVPYDQPAEAAPAEEEPAAGKEEPSLF